MSFPFASTSSSDSLPLGRSSSSPVLPASDSLSPYSSCTTSTPATSHLSLPNFISSRPSILFDGAQFSGSFASPPSTISFSPSSPPIFSPPITSPPRTSYFSSSTPGASTSPGSPASSTLSSPTSSPCAGSPNRRYSLLPLEVEYHTTPKSRRISAPAGTYHLSRSSTTTPPRLPTLTTSAPNTLRRPPMPDRHQASSSPFLFLHRHAPPSPVPTRLIPLCDGQTTLRDTVPKGTMETLARPSSRLGGSTTMDEALNLSDRE